MNVSRIAICSFVAFVCVCLLGFGLEWIQDAEKARSEQLRQSRFIACTSPTTPNAVVAGEPLAYV